jgi:hypothetical protein
MKAIIYSLTLRPLQDGSVAPVLRLCLPHLLLDITEEFQKLWKSQPFPGIARNVSENGLQILPVLLGHEDWELYAAGF